MITTPLGLFLTWTVDGSFLSGNSRGWRHHTAGQQSPQPELEMWHHDRLKHEVVTLSDSMRRVAEAAIREICTVRNWSLCAVPVRSNHTHVVVSAPDYAPQLVRDQLKAKSTRELRAADTVWLNRPVWSAKGDIEFLDTDTEIEQCVLYVNSQDRKDRDLL